MKPAKSAPSAIKLDLNADVSVAALKSRILHNLKCRMARDTLSAKSRDWWMAVSQTVQDLLVERMIATMNHYRQENTRRGYYLSLEYLLGRLLDNNLRNAGVHANMAKALRDLGQDLDALVQSEYDMGLGNGGLGRLAACFLDSMATLSLPCMGYGIRYQFGLFRQEFVQGRQVEHPDSWLTYGDPWEIHRPEYSLSIRLYGRIHNEFDDQGRYKPRWVDTREVIGCAYDVPVAGYGNNTVNILRLWESRATADLDFRLFNEGGYVEAVRDRVMVETISKVLYPNDATENGKELRLVQQYFFIACSLQDILRRFREGNGDHWDLLPEKIVLQLNDTHPALAVAELMRVLHDEFDLPWERAWGLTHRIFAYTNHTLLPEALERWSVPLLEKVLPRHLQIIFEINRRLLVEVGRAWPGDLDRLRACSLIEEGSPKQVRMANLAVVGSFSVNGVAAIHSELLRRDLFPHFHALYPGKFNNKTNGITPRRWLYAANPRLAELISSRIGDAWVADLDRLRELEKFAEDAEFQTAFQAVKRHNKQALAEVIRAECGVEVSPDALFDVQIKRLHEYKRQHLNLLHILALYRRLLQDPGLDITPRVFVFAAKAAPGYEMAKTIIHAINAVAARINHDPRVQDRLKVVFLPNYRVSLAEKIIPAADLSEQISTAGKEASGTGNMKLALNGALTIGTLDGANIEIRDAVGEENIFIFGLTVDQVKELRASGYHPWSYYENHEELRAVVEWIGSDYFTPGEPGALAGLRHGLLQGGDPFLVLADYAAYAAAQEQVDHAYRDPADWARKAILNVARVGFFSSDRTIQDYNREIWKLPTIRT
jgi:starch phosphorylase